MTDFCASNSNYCSMFTCSKSTAETLKKKEWYMSRANNKYSKSRSGVFIVNFENIFT